MGSQNDPNFYELFQQLGQIQNGQQNIAEQLAQMRGQQDARHDENRRAITDQMNKLRDFKHDQANVQQENLARLAKIERDVKIAAVEIHELRRPVNEIIAIRSKIGIVAAAILSVGGAVWFFVGPVWSFLYQKFISGVFSGVKMP